MVFGLIALLVLLSLPTMMELAAILGKRGATSRHAPLVKNIQPQSARVSSSSRLTSVRVQPEPDHRAVAELRVAH